MKFQQVVVSFVIIWMARTANDNHFLENPKPLHRPLGANAIFECRVRGVQLDSVYWCINGSARCNVVNDFENTSFSFNMTTSNAFLHVTATTFYNGSRFRCCFTDRSRRRLCSRPAKLFVFATSRNGGDCRASEMLAPSVRTTWYMSPSLSTPSVPSDLPTEERNAHNTMSDAASSGHMAIVPTTICSALSILVFFFQYLILAT